MLWLQAEERAGGGAMSTAISREKTAPQVQSDPRPKGARTRDRLLDLAFESMVTKGFAATSIEELADGAGISKSGFFYHFKDKHDLARAVLTRFRAHNDALFDRLAARARELSDDPLHSFLIFLKLYAEEVTPLMDLAPGCLVSTIAYQERCFAHDIRLANADMVEAWRARFRVWLEEIAAVYGQPAELELLVDAGWSAIFGAFTLAKTRGRADVVAAQVLLYRDTISRVFLQARRGG